MVGRYTVVLIVSVIGLRYSALPAQWQLSRTLQPKYGPPRTRRGCSGAYRPIADSKAAIGAIRRMAAGLQAVP
jgi:hypothetical protein